MTSLAVQDINSFVFASNDEIKTTSLLVAEKFGKLHKNVIAKIKALECSPEFAELNFKLSKYEVVGGKNTTREEDMYEMTKDGFMFLVMGFTGKAAAQIKEAYINAFNLMHAKLFPKTQHSLIEIATITNAQYGVLSAIVADIATSSGKEGTTKVALWSRFATHFKIGKARELPASKFDEAKIYLESKKAEYDRGFTLAVVKKDDLQTLGYDSETKMFAVRALEHQKPKTEWSGMGYASMILGTNDNSRLLIQPHGDVTVISRLRDDDFAGTFETVVRELKLRGFHVVKDCPENKLETIEKIVTAKFEA